MVVIITANKYFASSLCFATLISDYFERAHVFIVKTRLTSLTVGLTPLYLKNTKHVLFIRLQGKLWYQAIWILSFSRQWRRNRPNLAGWNIHRERKYVQTKRKYPSPAPNWSMHGEKQFGKAKIAFRLSIILLRRFLQIVNQILSLCLSALGSWILSGGRSWHFYFIAQFPLCVSIGFLFPLLNLFL